MSFIFIVLFCCIVQTFEIYLSLDLTIPFPLTLKVPIMTVADDKFCDTFPNFRQNSGIILHENRLPADDSHEISFPYLLFLKKWQNLQLSSAANYRWRFKG